MNVPATHPTQGLSTITRRPVSPSATGLTDRSDASNALAAGAFDNPWTPTAKKYQYWAIKFKPYIDTMLKLTNTFYVDQVFQIDLNINMESFKSAFWADVSLWY